MCEAIFETVRKKDFPAKPSRIWGIYLSSTEEIAEDFRKTERTERARIYKIETSHPENVHVFNMDLYTEADLKLQADPLSKKAYEFAFEKAALYWSGNTDSQTVNREWLVDDDVMVRKCIG